MRDFFSSNGEGNSLLFNEGVMGQNFQYLSDQQLKKNSLGYYDSKSKELYLKHPFSKKKEAEDVYEWAECAQTHGLEKIVIGIGAIEGFMAETAIDDIYLSSRAVMRQALEHTKAFDANVLIEILLRVEKCKDLKVISLKHKKML